MLRLVGNETNLDSSNITHSYRLVRTQVVAVYVINFSAGSIDAATER